MQDEDFEVLRWALTAVQPAVTSADALVISRMR